MSKNKMLIDATHAEETRVVVLRDGRVEEFDYESAARKLLRGSIYLAKITRVEPSLQAAFVDYGGNRHGFLAFSEIHPDYYQIPHADKLALLEEEAREREAALADEADDDDDAPYPQEARADGEPGEASDDDDQESDGATNADETGDVDVSALEPVATEVEDRDDHEAAAPDGDEPVHGAAEPDFEAIAIDVTAYLPPEEPVVEAAGETDEETAATAPEVEPETPRSQALDIQTDAEDVLRSEPEASLDDVPTDQSAEADDSDEPAIESMNAASDDDGADTGSDVDDENDDDGDRDEDDVVESLNDGEDDSDEMYAGDDADVDDEPTSRRRTRSRGRPERPRRRVRQYKIQEVIKRRQIVLIQVVKEERGNKGAALTTYLSLAGRYTVLMPNTARGGGISRKITNIQDRKRLKAIAQELDVPEGMGLIIRTAGASRTKQEIRRDFDYLLRLWENVRSLTLESSAPCLVYEEGNLIKRSIRDLYSKDVDEILVAGETAHKEAKGFMRMLMPSHAKNVLRHDERQSLFAKFGIEQQLNAMFSPVVQLPSGGYLVVNQTEALVAVDVNSGKATREFSIEETALKTNLEAAAELARQLKLRDLAGLIVIDFIDMEEKRNNRAVERKLKDCLRSDRARIQIGRISHFGLLEMSRQRLRTGVLEGSTMPCAHCQGSGIVRSTESVSLAVLRALEDTLIAGRARSCVASTSAEVALYLLNQKRGFIQELEDRYGVTIHIRASDNHQGASFAIDPLHIEGEVAARPTRREAVNIDTGFTARTADDEEAGDERGERKSRRRRRRRGRRDDEGDEAEPLTAAPADDGDVAGDEETENGEVDAQGDDAGDARPRRSRRRGRRGGRRNREQRVGASPDDVAMPGAEQPVIDFNDDREASGHDDVPSAGDAADADEAPSDDVDVVVAAASWDMVADADNDTDDIAAAAAAPAADEPTVASRMQSLDPTAAETVPSEADEAFAAGDDVVSAPLAVDEPVEADAADATTDDVAGDDHADEAIASGDDRTAEMASSEDDAAEDDETERSRAARFNPIAGEPVMQRVVVGATNGHAQEGAKTEDDQTPSEAPAAKQPQRRGWWQRQFGG